MKNKPKIKWRNFKIWITDQFKRKVWFRNFFITGNAWGAFSIWSHMNQHTMQPKVMYNTKETAEKSAYIMGKKCNRHFSYYKCLFCDGYHIGKNRDNVSQVCLVPDLELQTFKIQITMKKEQNLKEPHKQALNIPVVSGWRSFSDEKPLDGKRYHYSQGNQFFKGVWSDKLQGFLLDGCGGKYISRMCDYFHACH